MLVVLSYSTSVDYELRSSLHFQYHRFWSAHARVVPQASGLRSQNFRGVYHAISKQVHPVMSILYEAAYMSTGSRKPVHKITIGSRSALLSNNTLLPQIFVMFLSMREDGGVDGVSPDGQRNLEQSTHQHARASQPWHDSRSQRDRRKGP